METLFSACLNVRVRCGDGRVTSCESHASPPLSCPHGTVWKHPILASPPRNGPLVERKGSDADLDSQAGVRELAAASAPRRGDYGGGLWPDGLGLCTRDRNVASSNPRASGH